MERSELSLGLQKRKRVAGESPSPEKKRLSLTASNENGPALCPRCHNVQWQELVDDPPLTVKGKSVADLSTIDRSFLSKSTCPVCKLLAQITPESMNGKQCQLMALLSSFAIFGSKPRTKNMKCTVLFPVLTTRTKDKTDKSRIKYDWYKGGCLALVKSGNGGRLPETGPRWISEEVNFQLLKGWLEQCTTHHGNICGTMGSGDHNIRGLQVIDCYSRTTINAPARCRYLALSYVWGEKREGNAMHLPVVLDAMKATQSLGEQYLWVDQLCIDQIPGPKKDEQLAQMHKIYSQAYLTLVAAAGQDSTYGLPGLGSRQRHVQEQVSIGNITMIQMFPHTSAQIFTSKWASRGWTYQECYLSPRRLIFTDRQVSYLCNKMHQAESVKKPNHLTEPERKAELESFLEIIPNTSDSSNSPGNNNKEWLQLKIRQLPNYTSRGLTREEDSLNAIFGLFRTLEPCGIRQLHGVPIRKNLDLAQPHIHIHINWYHETVSYRRPQFPSWSWSGWQGGIRMRAHDISVPHNCTIELLDQNLSKLLPLQTWFTQAMGNANLSSPTTPQTLRITALTVKVKLEQKNWTDLSENQSSESSAKDGRYVNGIYAVLPISDGVQALNYANMDEDVSLDIERLGLVLQGGYSPWNPQRGNCILLLKEGEQCYHRIGLVRVSGSDTSHVPLVKDSIEPQLVYVDSEGKHLDKINWGSDCPLWLQGAEQRSIIIA